MLYLEHYEKALAIMSDPAFLKQEVLLAYYNDSTYRNRAGYAVNGLHWGYTDNLVEWLNDKEEYGAVAFVHDDRLKKHPQYSHWKSIYTVVEFYHIKDSIMLTLSQKLKVAREREEEYLRLRKDKEEITIPLSFEGKEFLLVKYDDNYADEFNVHGFRIFTKEEWEGWKSKLKKKNLSAGFGTNEACEYETKQDLLDSMKVTSISPEIAKVLFEVFGSPKNYYLDWNGRYHNKIIHTNIVSYGMFPDYLGDGEDEDEDEDNED